MKLSKQNVIFCENITFYSPKDEQAFFEWIKKIECVQNFSLKDNNVYLYLTKRKLNNGELSNIIGLLYRYNIDMEQLSRFLTTQNKKWFYDNKIAFWHKNVFKE